MKFYEYHPLTGFLIGWHEDAARINSTTVAPTVPPSRARWNGEAWIEDASREQAEEAAAVARQVVGMVQARLDDLAKSWGYDHILSLCTYATSSVPRFRAEGQAGVDWRDATWAYVNQAQHTAPSLEALISGLPPIPERPASGRPSDQPLS